MTITGNGTGRRITTHEATVKTATIEIKSLSIGAKQVTLAVFRQLIREDLVDVETAVLRGVPWGIVTYHPDQCSAEPEHLHVVWQLGHELRRAHVPARWPPEKERYARRQAVRLKTIGERFVSALGFVARVHAYDSTFTYGAVRQAMLTYQVSIADLVIPTREDGSGDLRMAATSPDGLDAYERGRLEHRAEMSWSEQQKDVVRAGHKAVAAILASAEVLAYRQLEAERAREAQPWTEQYMVLRQLDQLFIAV